MSKHHEKPLGTCCCGCFTVRNGVNLFTAFCLFISVCGAIGLVSEDTRLLVGGYGYWTRVIVGLLGVGGVILSLMSFIGLGDNHTRWVRTFANYFSFRFVVRVIIFFLDWSALATCSKLAQSGNMFSSLTGNYNVALATVALAGQCVMTRYWYLVLSVLDIFFSLYGLWNTYHWCWIMDHGPMFNIALDDTKPLRIYTGYASLGYPSTPYGQPTGEGYAQP